MDEKTFLSKFQFDTNLVGAIGVEREYFLTDSNGTPVPKSHDFLTHINNPAWTYELSACQVEHRTTAVYDIKNIVNQLETGQGEGQRVATEALGVRLSVLEVAPESMTLEVYAHDVRYAAIEAKLPQETLNAACRVTGTHIHVGTRNIQEAIHVHNLVVANLDNFMAMGDHSHGERLRLYRVMATNWKPPHYESTAHFWAVAREQGFEENLRDCWHLVRISRYGTVELRMFGMTQSAEEIASWIMSIRRLIAVH